MRKVLLLALALGLVLSLAGCGGGTELNDETFADFWIEYWHAETDAAERAVEEKYGFSERELEKFYEELIENESRFEKVVERISAKDEEAAAGFALGMMFLHGLF